MGRLTKFIIFLILVIAILTALSGFYVDMLWFKDLGYLQLFWTPIISKALIQIVNGTILFAFITATLLSIRHAIVTFINDRLNSRLHMVKNIDQPIYNLSQRTITIWLIIFSAVISFFISFVSGFTGWLEVLTFLHATPFGKSDPIFGLDLSFYFFKLPFLLTIYNTFFGPLFLLTIATGAFYTVTGVLRFRSYKLWQPYAVEVGKEARRHLAVLLGVLLAFKAFGYVLDIFQLVYSVHGHVVGAGYTDLHASLPALKILIILSIIGCFLAWSSLIFKEIRLLTMPVVTIFACSILLYGIYPNLVQSIIVTPNEFNKEAPYIQNEIALTRFGYGLDKVKEQAYQGNIPLTVNSLKADQVTLNNIRLNDPRPLLQTYNQEQGIRLYYKFNNINIDRYTINNDYRQVMLSARELSTPDLPPGAQTFVNTRFKYTHGFGVAASFANAVTSEGLPSFAIKDVPPVTNFPELKIKQPRIYYGKSTNNWVVVDTSVKEFDYPLGNTNAENHYHGKTGIELTPFNKLMVSLHLGTPQLYLASEVNSQSRLLITRNIKDRVEKLAPFLTYDSDPYIVIDNGRLKWIMDAYTTSDQLPYAKKYGDQNFNYIRNSVKVVIDAYDGAVDFYASDPTDPILQTYRKIFPGVFKDMSQMPSSLKAHLRYPETLFTVQANMLENFHMTDPSVFYNKEDAWDIAKELFNANPQDIKPYYTILKIPGNDKPEFVLMIPFTPASSESNTRNNMVAWLAARMDGNKYGQLLLYTLPKNIDINGPLQVESQIDQDPNISQQLTLWNQQGSSVIRGDMMVLPIGGNFLYVEPIYLQSDQSGSIPEMKKVVLAYQDKLVMTDNLGEALTKIFGNNAPQPSTPGQTAPISPNQLTPEVPSSPQVSGATAASILDQINQVRAILDNLESQLKGSSGGSSSAPSSSH